MHVIKRDGTKEKVQFDKVQQRLAKAAKGLDVNTILIAQRVLARIYNGVHTSELDELSAQLAISLTTTHYDYGTLAARIAISNHQKNTEACFTTVMEMLANQRHPKTGEPVSYINDELLAAARTHKDAINARINHERDFVFDYFGFKTLERAYLLKDAKGKILERPQHLWMRVSLALWPSNPERAFETYDLMSTKAFTHATPTLFNAGTPNQQLSSCFLIAMKEDSIRGIYDTLEDCALISKHAGGIGLHCSNIRAKGSLIKGTNGTSNGLMPMLRVFNSTARYVDQGGNKRNGSFAIYLEPWHADVEDFLRMKLPTGTEEERARDLFYALWTPDLFMERVQAEGNWTLFCPSEAPGLSDVWGPEFKALYERYETEGRGRKTMKAQDLWFQILQAQIETGTPYLLFKDAANAKSNQQNLGTIKSSNLCVAPETTIYTDKGIYPISSLANKTVNVWNGDKWSETTVLKTGEAQKLIKVTLSNGVELECTPYHKFIIRESYHDYKPIAKATRVEAKDLKPGMKLTKFKQVSIEGDKLNDFKYPYTHGFFCGDGTYSTTGKPLCSLYGDKKDLLPYLQIRSTSGIPDSSGRLNTSLPHDLEKKYSVPNNSSIECRLKWFEGICDADGSVCNNGTNQSLQISSVNNEFLQNIRLMLLTLGVNAKVTKAFEQRQTLLPDGHGGQKLFECQELWRLLVSSSGVKTLLDLGFSPKRLKINDRQPQRNAEQFVYVVSVSDLGRIDDTYCFNEPINHAGVFNGILTGNCTEIIEYSSKEETAVCNLASIGLPSFVNVPRSGARGTFDYDKLRAAVKVVTRNLDRVIDINFYPTPETRTSNMRHRPVGLGVQGLADVFALMRVPWESDKAAEINQRIFEHIYYAALETSAELAQELGAYSTFAGSPASQGKLQFDMWLSPTDEPVIPLTQTDGTLDWSSLRAKVVAGRRNSLLVAPMPTASTSQILGFNECFEPVTTNIYTRRTLAGEFVIVNKYLMRDLIKFGLWNEEMKQKIIVQNGSIQGLDEIPQMLQDLYKTAWEIKQKTLIDMAAARGAFICQSQSLNLFISDPTFAKLSSMHFYGWKKGLKTGIYYLRTRAPIMAQKFTVDPDLQAAIIAAKAKQEKEETEGCTMCSA